MTNFFLAVKNVVKFSVTNLRPICPGKVDRKVATKNLPHFSFAPKFKMSSP